MNVKHYPVREPNESQGEDSEEFVTLARRQEPLSNLEELKVHGVCDWLTTINIRSMFAHCPNIKKLEVSGITGQGDIDAVGPFIGKVCPKIEWLKYDNPVLWRHDPLPLKLMESLPAQQVNMFIYSGIITTADSLGVRAAIQHHSTTLRHIRIDSSTSSQKMSASVIFKECCNLEELSISIYSTTGHYITLEDALESPWTCAKLRRLELGISGCEVPIEPEVLPYYSRPIPITISDAETSHFAQLEQLYKQIGALTSLQHLNLRMVSFNEHGQAFVGQSDEHQSFPGWLRLQDSLTGRPGYLQLLSGLKQLEYLEGSVRMDSVENKELEGWREAKWMEENWPSLRRAQFFARKTDVSTPFLWLLYKREILDKTDFRLWDLYAC
ncbi:hypothetical protein BGZ95_011708 [Linnemannia exigua]|uniref:Uncharacterized protein n=1 Tax=Linnemannia exigua TaxID=604196 RepID=A0AAD4D9J4_9FUNG|nr:hypothetical protein BGZ95_011708 [Linnemannia exigua]